MATLDLSSFEKALASLERAVVRSEREPTDLEVRDSVIQRFEYTYELCWKMLKRRLELDVPTPTEVDSFSFRELIREGAERGLVDDPEVWFEFRERRNLTSHAYDDAKAKQVYETALSFVAAARSLLEKLRRRSST